MRQYTWLSTTARGGAAATRAPTTAQMPLMMAAKAWPRAVEAIKVMVYI